MKNKVFIGIKLIGGTLMILGMGLLALKDIKGLTIFLVGGVMFFPKSFQFWKEV